MRYDSSMTIKNKNFKFYLNCLSRSSGILKVNVTGISKRDVKVNVTGIGKSDVKVNVTGKCYRYQQE